LTKAETALGKALREIPREQFETAFLNDDKNARSCANVLPGDMRLCHNGNQQTGIIHRCRERIR
jgi:hypothetical protein